MACNRSIQLLKCLNIQRLEQLFCDVDVIIGGSHRFPAHRCVLAASSAKLHSLTVSAMATAHSDASCMISLDRVTANGFQPVLEYIYTGMLMLNRDNVGDVLTVGYYLDLADVVESCKNFYSGNTTQNDQMNQLLMKGSCRYESSPSLSGHWPYGPLHATTQGKPQP